MTALAERPLEHDSSGRPLWHGLGYPLVVWAGTRAMRYWFVQMVFLNLSITRNRSLAGSV